MVPYTSCNLLIISETRAYRPKFQTRSVMAPHKDHTIPSLSAASSKIHYSNKASPFWVGSLLKALNYGILPTTCEVTLGQEFSHCGTDIGLDNCTLTPYPGHFLPFLPVVAPLPASSVPVWQCHIQCAHYDPPVFQ